VASSVSGRASDESNQRSDKQLELQDELDTLEALEEGFDNWDVFDQSEDEAA
jgi:hypothetical protein